MYHLILYFTLNIRINICSLFVTQNFKKLIKSTIQYTFNFCYLDSKLPIGLLIGIDLQQMYPIKGVTLLGNADFTAPKTWKKIKEFLNGRSIDVVLSDMAPNATGVKHLDHDLIIRLAYSVIQ